jgi:hypothetical protein
MFSSQIVFSYMILSSDFLVRLFDQLWSVCNSQCSHVAAVLHIDHALQVRCWQYFRNCKQLYMVLECRLRMPREASRGPPWADRTGGTLRYESNCPKEATLFTSKPSILIWQTSFLWLMMLPFIPSVWSIWHSSLSADMDSLHVIEHSHTDP